MPALLTTASMRPKVSTAEEMIRFADSQSATLSVLATAFLPISSATFWAGPASLPSPLTEVPMSLTSTLAPAAAMASAKSRPMPPPAPVTTTTLPSRGFNRGSRAASGRRGAGAPATRGVPSAGAFPACRGARSSG